MRRILSRLLLVALGLLVGLGVAEAVFRRIYIETESAIFFRAGSAQFGWFHIPNKTGWFGLDDEEFRAYVHINSQGFRDREIPYAKPADTFRILFLGDSFVEGFQVAQEQTVAKALEALLNRRGDGVRYEVINAGVGGWGTDNELLFFRHEGVRYRPNLVLLGFLAGNDVANNSYVLEDALYSRVYKPYFVLNGDTLELRNFPYSGPLNVAPPPSSRPAARSAGEAVIHWLEDRSRLFQFIRFTQQQQVVGDAAADEAMAVVPDTVPLRYELYRTEYDATWQEAWRITGALLGQLQTEVAAQGSRLAVISLPAKLRVHDDLWQEVLAQYPAMQSVGWDLARPDRLLADIAARHGIPFFALADGLRAEAAARSGTLYFPRDGHWNADGHAAAARLLADYLASAGLLPGTPD